MKLIPCLLFFLSILSLVYTRGISLAKEKEAKKYLLFARLAYCDLFEIKKNTCGLCKELSDSGHVLMFALQNSYGYDKLKIKMQLVITRSSKETVIAFSGPKSEDIEALSSLYLKGMAPVPVLGGMEIEEDFWNIYALIREPFMDQLKNILTNYTGKVVFTGHSFGGSIAALAAYDMVYNKITPKIEQLFLFPFSPLRIGPKNFLTQVQKEIKAPIVRIKKKYDLLTLIPYCVYVKSEDKLKCFDNPVTLVKTFPAYFLYFKSMKVKHIERFKHKGKLTIHGHIHPTKAMKLLATTNQVIPGKGKNQYYIQELEPFEKISSHHRHRHRHGNRNHCMDDYNCLGLDWHPSHKSHHHHRDHDNIHNHHFDISKHRHHHLDIHKHHHHKARDADNQNLDTKNHHHHKHHHHEHHQHKRHHRKHHHHNRHYLKKYRIKKIHKKKIKKYIKEKKKTKHYEHRFSTKKKVEHHRSFLEKKMKLKNRMKTWISQVAVHLKNCESFDDYVSCKFNPEIHKQLLGVNMENCK